MNVKKAFGKIYGAELTKDEEKAVMMELKDTLKEYDKNHAIELDAIILWVLHEQLGFGPKRLKRFFHGFSEAMDSLMERYSMEEEDKLWLCTKMLKDYGVDVTELNAEYLKNKG